MTEIKKGTKVRIPKGTMVHSMKDGQTKAAGRTYTVTVDHTLESMKIPLGNRYFDKDQKEAENSPSLYWSSRNDIHTAEKIHRTSDLEKLVERSENGPLRKTSKGTYYCTIYLEVRGAQVRWAGTGGYWGSADIKDVEVLEA